MQMFRVRFTVRRMMVVVAVAAVALTLLAGVLRDRRRSQYLRLAAFHEREGSRIAEMLDMEGRSRRMWMKPDPASNRWLAVPREEVEYRVQMRRKYECAAAHPWLSVEPDPPIPTAMRPSTSSSGPSATPTRGSRSRRR
jgi:hypothetical protein